jgi:hypothetical protein
MPRDYHIVPERSYLDRDVYGNSHNVGIPVFSTIGRGRPGLDGEKGDPGEAFSFDDMTQEQIDELIANIAATMADADDDVVVTDGDNTTVIGIPFVNWVPENILFVDVEGLDLAPGVDYTIDDNTIVLTEPIVNPNTRVHFRQIRYSTSITPLMQAAIDATSDARDAITDVEGAITSANVAVSNINDLVSDIATITSTANDAVIAMGNALDDMTDMETDISNAESLRVQAEQARELAEEDRENTEQGRVAAENARQTAETERQADEMARATAEGTRQANERDRQTNEQNRNAAMDHYLEAAQSAANAEQQAADNLNAALDALGDISEISVPEMSTTTRGGAKVGGSTQVIGEKLEVKLSESATGTSITTGSTSALRELQVHGKSVQDGTPTPDAPVPVQVVEGPLSLVIGDASVAINLQGNTLASINDIYRDTLDIDSAGHIMLTKRTGSVNVASDFNWKWATGFPGPYVHALTGIEKIPSAVDDGNLRIWSNRFAYGGTYTSNHGRPYVVCLGLTNNATDIVFYPGDDSVTDVATWKTWLNQHPTTLIYPLTDTAWQTIDLGYIDPPAIPSGSVVTVSASLTPTFDLDCWTKHASEIPAQMHDWYDRLKEDIDDIVYGDLGVVPVSKGGTGATDAAGARASLGAASQSDLVALGNRLDAIGDYEVEHGIITYPSITANTYSDHAVVFAEAMSAIPTVVAAPTGSEDVYLDVRDITANGFTVRCHNRSSRLIADDASVSINSGSNVTIPFADYANTDLLFVDIEGLDLVAGTDYTISGNIITLARPITHSGTHVHLRRVRNAHGASVTPTVLWLAVVG